MGLGGRAVGVTAGAQGIGRAMVQQLAAACARASFDTGAELVADGGMTCRMICPG